MKAVNFTAITAKAAISVAKLSQRQSVADACATERFAVSFCISSMSFVLPEGRTRIFMEDQAASSLKTLAEESKLADPKVSLVFLTDVNDTRFDEYGVLRPLTTAQLTE